MRGKKIVVEEYSQMLQFLNKQARLIWELLPKNVELTPDEVVSIIEARKDRLETVQSSYQIWYQYRKSLKVAEAIREVD